MILTLCGSFSFVEHFLEIHKELTTAGLRVLMPSMDAEQRYQEARAQDDPQALISLKHQLITAHLQRIQESDAILVVNEQKRGINGYIGANTLIELGAALMTHKKNFLLHQPSDTAFGLDEIMALQATILHGSLETLKNQKENI